MSRIGHKINAVVAAVVTISLLTLGGFYISHEEQAILAQNERTMVKLTESVSQAIKSLMVAGYADIAHDFANRLETVEGVVDFRIIRVDGYQAFLDNRTITDVNERKGKVEFLLREDVNEIRVLPTEHPVLRDTLTDQAIHSYYEDTPDGERFLTFLAPIKNDEVCHECHGDERPIRGILKLTTSLTEVQHDIQNIWRQSIIVFLLAIIGIVIITNLLINRTVVTPIDAVTRAMRQATHGDLNAHVPVLGRDELSQMADSFNMMTEQLERTYEGLQSEQDKLATIILSAQEGIVVTDSLGRVVLVNPAAERLLNKPAELIEEQGFMEILDDAEGLRHLLERDADIKQPETVHYNEYVLSVYADTIRSPTGKQVGSAALIRDITEEKRMEERLRQLSTTDGLTGIYNRRFMDETVDQELKRAQRYRKDLSIFMFDVDHFKQFNDTYGHERGDRILKIIANVLQENMRTVDVACRYGGEEFLAILPDTDREGARIVAERTRQQIEGTEVDGLRVTVSAGVASVPYLHTYNPLHFVEAADQALYTAKRTGRNRVVLADHSHLQYIVKEREG